MQKAVFRVLLWRILVEKHEADKAGKDSWKVGHRDVWVSEAKPIDGPGGRGKKGGNGQ